MASSTLSPQPLFGKGKKVELAAIAPVAPITPLTRRLELRRAEFIELTEIDCAAQSFKGQLYLEFYFPDGAKDVDLSASGSDFPIGPNGKPTFRPPAGWYAKQFDFNNALYHQLLDEPVVRRHGDDLFFGLRYVGQWWEPMELKEFPFDAQDLTVSLAINCRTVGMMPVNLVVSPDADLSLSHNGFALRQSWRPRVALNVEEMLVGASEDRLFPTLTISALVLRRPGFVGFNVMLPMGSFPLLALCQYFVPIEECESRLAITLTLVLTSVAYKSEVGRMTPDISYLTLVDKYVLMCTFLMYLMVFESTMLYWLQHGYEAETSLNKWNAAGLHTPADPAAAAPADVASNWTQLASIYYWTTIYGTDRAAAVDALDFICFIVTFAIILFMHLHIYYSHRLYIRAALLDMPEATSSKTSSFDLNWRAVRDKKKQRLEERDKLVRAMTKTWLNSRTTDSLRTSQGTPQGNDESASRWSNVRMVQTLKRSVGSIAPAPTSRMPIPTMDQKARAARAGAGSREQGAGMHTWSPSAPRPTVIDEADETAGWPNTTNTAAADADAATCDALPAADADADADAATPNDALNATPAPPQEPLASKLSADRGDKRVVGSDAPHYRNAPHSETAGSAKTARNAAKPSAPVPRLSPLTVPSSSPSSSSSAATSASPRQLSPQPSAQPSVSLQPSRVHGVERAAVAPAGLGATH